MSVSCSERPSAPQPISIETRRFWLRDLQLSDDLARAAAWLGDPVKARMVNAPARALTVEQFRAYLVSHDGISGYLLGVFEKTGGGLVGLWSAYVDWAHSEFQLNVLMGERGPVSVNARAETQRELLRYFFDTLSLTTLCCNVLAENDAIAAKVFRAAGVEPEHTSFRPSADGPFVEIEHYRVSRDTWRGIVARAASDDRLAAQLGV